jgi:hypothetical protein
LPITQWQDPLVLSLLGGVAVLTVALAWSMLRRWFAVVPVRRLFGKAATEPTTLGLCLRGMFVPGNEFFSRQPEYPPVAGGGVTVHKWTNVPEVYGAADVRAATDVLQLLFATNSGLTITYQSAESAQNVGSDDVISIGTHYKSLQLLGSFEPKLVIFRSPDAFRSLVTPEVFEAKGGTDFGLIYKGRHPSTGRGCWVLMGVGDAGTLAAARYLRTNARQLGAFTGAAAFAAIVSVEAGRGPDQAVLRALLPAPPWWRRLLRRRQWQALVAPRAGAVPPRSAPPAAPPPAAT